MPQLRFGPAIVSAESFTGLPLSGPITARFGTRDIPQHAGGHSGVDIGAPVGAPVLAPAAGLVTAAEQTSGVFGSYVLIRHAGAFVSLYAHLSRIDAARGQQVRRGDGLGLVGMTGLTTGPHLHWGLSEGGTPLVAGPHLRDALRFVSPAPLELDRERLFAGVALGMLGTLQAAGALLGTRTEEDFEQFAEGSPERQILAIQQAANAFIARYAG